MTVDLDKPTLPPIFDEDIINYALLSYHEKQRDWMEV
jgi:hypothetical protein